MGKYTPFTDWLKSLPQDQDSVVLTFTDIERIIAPHKLPPIARRYQNSNLFCLRWWDNVPGASESDARLNAGFQVVMVDMENETVKLQRV